MYSFESKHLLPKIIAYDVTTIQQKNSQINTRYTTPTNLRFLVSDNSFNKENENI